MKFKKINLLILFLIKLVYSNDQLINFVPDTNDFDLIASETIDNQYSQVVDLTTKEYLQECLQAHNEKRKLHGSENLIYDEKLLSDAKEAAFHSAINGKLTRIDDSTWGENLAGSTKRLTCTNAVNLWYKQNKFYNYHVPIYGKETGGFTQLVWRETRRFACAQARLKTPGSRYFTVCVYDPFGNLSGQFRANVFPPIEFSASSSTNQPVPISPKTTTIKPIIKLVLARENDSLPFNLNESVNTELHEATLNVSPQELPRNEPSVPRTLVKPILNKSYRLSPGMLVKLKNFNRRKSESDIIKLNVEDKIEASASELNLFVQHNTISPTLDTAEISNLIKRKNETSNSLPKNETFKHAPSDLLTTITPF